MIIGKEQKGLEGSELFFMLGINENQVYKD